MASINNLDAILSNFNSSSTIAHVHIPKTAGTSVNRYFSSIKGFKNAEHSSCDHPGNICGSVKINSPVSGVGKNWPCYHDFLPHDSIVFSVTRNIFPWLLSYYKHRGTRRFGLFAHNGWQGVVDLLAPKSFAHFVELYLDATSWHFPPLLRGPLGQLLDANGTYHADFIIYSETLDVSLPYIQSKLGVYGAQQIPRSNVGNNSVDYRMYFDDSLVEKVFLRFPEFFELTGYGFDSIFTNQVKPECILLKKGSN